MPDPNLEQLIIAATALKPLLPELVFVGGCVTGLLITEDAPGHPRSTRDVDATAAINSNERYEEFALRLRALGFRGDTSDGAPLCRRVQGQTALDVMPIDERILGFPTAGTKPPWRRPSCASSLRTLKPASLPRHISSPRSSKPSIGVDTGTSLPVTIWRMLFPSSMVAKYSSANWNKLIDPSNDTCAPKLDRYYGIQSFLDAPPDMLFPHAVSQSRLSIVLTRLNERAGVDAKPSPT